MTRGRQRTNTEAPQEPVGQLSRRLRGRGCANCQSLPRGEAKDSALLSSRDAGLLEPPERRWIHWSLM